MFTYQKFNSTAHPGIWRPGPTAPSLSRRYATGDNYSKEQWWTKLHFICAFTDQYFINYSTDPIKNKPIRKIESALYIFCNGTLYPYVEIMF